MASYVPKIVDRNLPHGSTSQPDPLHFPNVAGQFGTEVVVDKRYIISAKAPMGVFDTLHINTRAQFDGEIYGPLRVTGGIILPRGSSVTPSIAYFDDLDTGIYSPGPGQVAVTVDGQPILSTSTTAVQVSAPITTNSGNLILNPSGGAVDFSGKAIINFSGFFTNPNRYDVVAPTFVDTIGAVTADLFTIGTVTDAAYTFLTTVTCITLDGVSRGSFVIINNAKNVGGVLSLSATVQSNIARDTPIVASTVTFFISGTDVIVQVNGVAGQNIHWFGATTVTRSAL